MGVMKELFKNVSTRWLLKEAAISGLKEADPKELVNLANFLSSYASRMDPQSVCYGFYSTFVLPDKKMWTEGGPVDVPKIRKILMKGIALSYRKMLIEWMEFAVVNRANVGGGGKGIPKVKNALKAFVEGIPDALSYRRGPANNLSDSLPKQEYIKPELVGPVGDKILKVVGQAAEKAGVRDTPHELREWYFDQWLPKNINRFTKVFSDFARNLQSSYQIIFKVSGGNVKVDFKRNINTAWQAVEELQYRYTNRQGRGPWLEVLDWFAKLVATTNPNQLITIIDRINGLQHSNGLFMDHFPPQIKKWYFGFLNAKFAASSTQSLIKHIKDSDLRSYLNFLISNSYGVTDPTRRLQDEQEAKWGPDFRKFEKVLEHMGGPDWRKLQYPYSKGTGKPDRFDPEVQRHITTFKELESMRKSLLETTPDDQGDFNKWKDKAQEVVDGFKKIKRKRGRPRKHPRAASVAYRWLSHHRLSPPTH
jgi:hypothetical protein